MNQTIPPFGARDKLGYLLGNLGNDFMFNFAGVFLMVFYTKVLGIASGLVGILFLSARFLDAITDITMGRIADRTRKTKNGKFRPWLLRIALPVTLVSFLMYQYKMAEAPMPLRILYMFVTYLLWGSVLYTAINIPYGSMASAISDDAADRASLSVFRSIATSIAGLIIGVLVPLYVYGKDTAGNEVVIPAHFTIAAAIFAVLSLVSYLLCYLLVRERVEIPPAEKENGSFKRAFLSLVKNRPLMSMITATVAILAAQLMTQSISQYLFIDYFESKNGAALMSVMGVVPGILLSPFALPLTKRFGKREIGIFGSFSAGLSSLVLYFLHTRSVWLYIAVSTLGFLGFSLLGLVMWAFITDIIDDTEVKTGKREDATIYGAYSFSRKLGQAIAGGLGGFALSAIGFDTALAVQSESVKEGIYLIATLIPAVLYFAVGAALWFYYPLTKKRVSENTELLRKRKGEKR